MQDRKTHYRCDFPEIGSELKNSLHLHVLFLSQNLGGGRGIKTNTNNFQTRLLTWNKTEVGICAATLAQCWSLSDAIEIQSVLPTPPGPPQPQLNNYISDRCSTRNVCLSCCYGSAHHRNLSQGADGVEFLLFFEMSPDSQICCCKKNHPAYVVVAMGEIQEK